MSNHGPRRVEVETPQSTGRQFALDQRAEPNLTLDADVMPETDLAVTRAARGEAQARYRNAGTEEERDEISGEIEELSLRVLAIDMREQYPDVSRSQNDTALTFPVPMAWSRADRPRRIPAAVHTSVVTQMMEMSSDAHAALARDELSGVQWTAAQSDLLR